MICQDIYLPKQDWHIRAFYAVTHYNISEILLSLKEARASDADMEVAFENLSSGNVNTGLCFSGNHVTILVISIASSAEQFFNSLIHETHHASTHIASALGYDLKGEEVCYLAGEIAQQMYPIVYEYLCKNCRHED